MAMDEYMREMLRRRKTSLIIQPRYTYQHYVNEVEAFLKDDTKVDLELDLTHAHGNVKRHKMRLFLLEYYQNILIFLPKKHKKMLYLIKIDIYIKRKYFDPKNDDPYKVD